MNDYTVIPNAAEFNAAKKNHMKIFKQGVNETPEEVMDNNNVTFSEGLYYTMNEGGTSSVTSSNGDAVAAQPTTDPAAASSASGLLKSLAENTDAMNKIQKIVTEVGESNADNSTTQPAAGGRRRSTRRRHKKSSKKSRRQSKKGGKKHKKSTKKGKKRSQRKH